MDAKGATFVYGDHVDTDVIIPARYLNHTEPEFLAAHCMEDIDPAFAGAVRHGDIIVAGENFGCGSSREHAPIAIAACGVACVIAKSFARIFYRNAINIGLPILECPDISASRGDVLSVDFERGIVRNITTGAHYSVAPFPEFIRNMIAAGGRMQYLMSKK